jgi:superfamily II DNA or RNA helicase
VPPLVRILPHNSVHSFVDCETSVALELADHFTFFVPGYRFNPKFKAGYWDGKISLFSAYKREIYCGLAENIKQFCVSNGYDFKDEANTPTYKLTTDEALAFIKTLKLPEKFELRDYQIDTFRTCLKDGRALFVSPTASGKSMMIYWLMRYYGKKTLIIVDSINLLHQLASDFVDYGFDPKFIHKIAAGAEKDSPCPVMISTWQSAVKQDKEWFDQFGLVIGDEAHKYKAKSLIQIMTSILNCPHKFGFTGSLDGSHTNQLTLEGLFGPKRQLITTKELMEQGHVAKLNIRCITLKHPEHVRQAFKKAKYDTERDFLVTRADRNNFLVNLALAQKGNTLILFRYLAHGKELERLFSTHPNFEQGRPLHYVSGETDGEVREEVRQIVNQQTNAIILASQVFVTGTNIPNINNIILASPTKSQVQLLQSIGRGLRKSAIKNDVIFYDISDDLSWKSRQNFGLIHFKERVKIYNKEKFDYKIINMELK